MIGKIVIGLIALLVLVGGIVGGVIYWNKLNAPETPVAGTAIGNDALDIAETSPATDVAPDAAGDTAAPEAPSTAETPVSRVENGNVEVEVPIGEESGEPVADIQPEVATTNRSVAERPVERPTTATREPRTVVGEIVDTTPVNTPAEGSSTAQGITIEPAPTPTPTPAVVTPVPTPVPTQVVPKGNFAVSSTTPVLGSQLPEIRKAMSRLGVQLVEQRGNQYPQQAYRVSIGYFVQKIEADNWGRTYLRPQRFEYNVYPVQGMYSIQIGVYTNRENVDRQISKLYQAFPGWRLPIRTEMTTIMQPTYKLSIRGIPETLARRIQSELFRFQIATELFSIS
ncbi:hypothetical protein U14_00031 [Candidatus Moduliflexus flocculans]|uniref:SPOR domain-containing protein n=1 Tax=Candidatus Moduliflexus flocculans TaxID=1499966 RepID=A0A0S6VPI2_9BACT|nr:hypothetical protein U14_00031 [Candidatus Moduliflexus flocculans]